MATLTTIRFARENTFYEVNIDFDDEGEDLIAFDVVAKVKVIDKKGDSYSATLRVELDLYNLSGRILLGEEELHRFSFEGINVSVDRKTGDETIPGIDGDSKLVDNVYDNIQNGIGKAIGEVIDAMPVPDPFFGCLIKASISSIVGQVIICNELRGNYGSDSRHLQIIRCLGNHVKGIAFRTLWRAARCMIRLGF